MIQMNTSGPRPNLVQLEDEILGFGKWGFRERWSRNAEVVYLWWLWMPLLPEPPPTAASTSLCITHTVQAESCPWKCLPWCFSFHRGYHHTSEHGGELEEPFPACTRLLDISKLASSKTATDCRFHFNNKISVCRDRNSPSPLKTAEGNRILLPKSHSVFSGVIKLMC